MPLYLTSNEGKADGMMDEARLRGIEVLATVRESTRRRVAELAQVRRVPAGQLILLMGEPAEAVYFVLEGEVRLARVSSQGREQLLALFGAGQMFNAVPLFLPDGVNAAQVRALQDTTLAVLYREDFLNLVQTCPDLALAFARDFAQRLWRQNRLLEDLALHSVRGRLARFLLEECTADKGMARRWTQDEMAARLGSVRDVIGRTLRAFADEGLIRFERSRIVIVDAEALQRVAEQE